MRNPQTNSQNIAGRDKGKKAMKEGRDIVPSVFSKGDKGGSKSVETKELDKGPSDDSKKIPAKVSIQGSGTVDEYLIEETNANKVVQIERCTRGNNKEELRVALR